MVRCFINGERFDKVVFCGNIKNLTQRLKGIDIYMFRRTIRNLEYHGTTSVFCEIDNNPYSWIYLPNNEYESHRIICTGNFATSNNADGKKTAAVEFTDEISYEDIISNLSKMPYNLRYLDHHYSKYTYPIQNSNTREMIHSLKKHLSSHNFYFTGRFADWEYYNMDVAMGAAMDTCKRIYS